MKSSMLTFLTKNKLKIIFILTLLVCILPSALSKKKKKFPRDNTVLIIDDNNFNKTISHFKTILIEYTSKWGGSLCERISEDVTKASIQLYKNKPRINIGRVYLDNNKKIERQVNAGKFPTLIYYEHGIPQDFTGVMNVKGIIKWMLKKNNPPLLELNTLSEISNFKNTHQVSIIYFGNDTNHISSLQTLAKEDGDNFYGYCDFVTAYTHYNAKKGMVVLYKNYGEERTELSGKLTLNGLRQFIIKNSANVLLELNDEAFQLIYEYKQPALIVFVDKNDMNHHEIYDRLFKKIGESIYGKLKFIRSGVVTKSEMHLVNLLNIDKKKLPALRIVDFRDERKRKFYEFEGKVNEKEIVNFVNEWEKGKLTIMLKGENPPSEKEKYENGLIKAVSKTFKKEVHDDKRNVLVYFYSKFMEKSIKKIGIFEWIGMDVHANEAKNKLLKLVKINIGDNELENLKITSFPKITLYKYDSVNDNKIEIQFTQTPVTYQNVVSFLNEHIEGLELTYPSFLDEQEEEEDINNDL